MKKNIIKIFNTDLALPIIFTILVWVKSLIAYLLDFSLGITDPLQIILLIINPLPLAFLIFLLPLFFKKNWVQETFMFLLLVAESALILFNVIYYREFTDFMTVNTILGYSKVSEGLSASSINLVKPHDIFYVIDLLIILGILLRKLFKHQPFRSLNTSNSPQKSINKKSLLALISCSMVGFFAVLSLSEIDRPQLLLRTFDRNYIVKYLGLDAFTFYDGFKTVQNKNVNVNKIPKNLNTVISYNKKNYIAPNVKYYGKAKGKNVFIIHLESFQQFLLNYELNGQEVTPFLNSLIKDKNVISFDNFFHEVGGGKTSDAETMLETGTFGLSQGSFFSSIAQNNTIQAAPAILAQNGNYTSAVFHGDSAGFWNRNNVYKNLGYDYFFYSDYYYQTPTSKVGMGTKDKLLFGESIKYLEHLPQPFYAKFITVTNHTPFTLDEAVDNFPLADTNDQVVNHYFRTAHYLDSSFEEFFNYLKNTGLLKKSIIVIYGDHFGISNDRNKKLAPLLNKSPEEWTKYDNAMLQRVPFIIYDQGIKGGVNHTFGGEIDVLPTLLHLLGVDTKNFVQLGQDLLSPKHQQVVAFRNHNFVTPKYTFYDGKYYDTITGELLEPDETQKKELQSIQKQVNDKLNASDLINNSNLLRYYTPPEFKPVNPKNYHYTNQYSRLLDQEAKDRFTNKSLFIDNSMNSTISEFQTTEPELINNPNELTVPPKTIKNQKIKK
ncbi:LTA synthase family protein [Xylocopilactobacillus apicola]|uniref:Alkaline phosphatase n=1 Tax=Xylocopilactobacillus apicola TaxID=2932184 RepID=A0AAU9D7T7_9LACO|nr:LTA synthase family protein [Xylocopilactobacillus apicola]BDR58451.1 alkaline phosphatase [Xylocopilactobacillus apicola]